MKNRKLSMPYWCVANPVGDPFGGAVMDRITSVEATDLLCKAREEKLIDFTSAHDDDLVAWDPHNLEDDQDPSSPASKTLKTIKEKLDGGGAEGGDDHLQPPLQSRSSGTAASPTRTPRCGCSRPARSCAPSASATTSARST